MAWWAVFLGVTLLAATFLDVLWTTLWVDSSAGPLTSKLTTAFWRGWRRLVGSERHRLLSLAGPMTLALITLMWVGMLWLGWTLIFAADEGALTSSTHARPFTWVDRLYFAGYSVFTLGNGDFAPARGGWQVLTVLAVASGLIVATLAITYLLSVISANVQKRTFARVVTGLGTTPEEIVRLGWDGSCLDSLAATLNTATTQLSSVTEQHQAYPARHYHHASEPQAAPSVAVAMLDEVLTLLMDGVADPVRPAMATLLPARRAVDHYLSNLVPSLVSPAERPLPPPRLAILREAGIPTVTDEAFGAALEAQADRRKQLLGLLESDARRWPPDAR